MIRSFRHKGLAELWATGKTRKIDAKLHGRILRRLEVLDQAERPEDLNVPGFISMRSGATSRNATPFM